MLFNAPIARRKSEVGSGLRRARYYPPPKFGYPSSSDSLFARMMKASCDEERVDVFRDAVMKVPASQFVINFQNFGNPFGLTDLYQEAVSVIRSNLRILC